MSKFYCCRFVTSCVKVSCSDIQVFSIVLMVALRIKLALVETESFGSSFVIPSQSGLYISLNTHPELPRVYDKCHTLVGRSCWNKRISVTRILSQIRCGVLEYSNSSTFCGKIVRHWKLLEVISSNSDLTDVVAANHNVVTELSPLWIMQGRDVPQLAIMVGSRCRRN